VRTFAREGELFSLSLPQRWLQLRGGLRGAVTKNQETFFKEEDAPLIHGRLQMARERLSDFGIMVTNRVFEASLNVIKVLALVADEKLLPNSARLLQSEDKITVQIAERKAMQKLDMLDDDSILSLTHENVVRVFALIKITKERVAIVMERKRGRSIFNDVQKSGPFQERQARIVIRAILLALQHLHACQIVVQDIAPHNILISGKRESLYSVKLASFDLAHSTFNLPEAEVSWRQRLDFTEVADVIRFMIPTGNFSSIGTDFLQKATGDVKERCFMSASEALSHEWLRNVRTSQERRDDVVIDATQSIASALQLDLDTGTTSSRFVVDTAHKYASNDESISDAESKS